jgi:NAD(P)H-dependent FMN reductase
MAGLDGYIFVMGEYNHSVPGVLKNALDYLYPELKRKPASFVAYGGVGGARGVEHLRNVLTELQATGIRHAVYIGLAELLGLLREGRDFGDYPHLATAANAMLDELLWWVTALKTARECG